MAKYTLMFRKKDCMGCHACEVACTGCRECLEACPFGAIGDRLAAEALPAKAG